MRSPSISVRQGAVLDGETGRLKFDGRDSQVAWLDSGHIVVERGSNTGALMGTFSVIDASTGEVRREIDNARLFATGLADTVLIGRHGAAGVDLLLIGGPGDVWHLGMLADRDEVCWIDSRALICTVVPGDGPWRIWWLPELR